MEKKLRKVLAFVMALSLLLSVDGISSIKSASAAKAPKLSAKKVTVKVKQSKKVTLKNKPKGAKVTWTSKNKKIATVTKQGKITGKKVGKTKVTCKVVYKKGSKKVTKKLTVNVTVKKAAAAATTAPTPTAATTASAGAVATTAPPAAPSVAPTAVSQTSAAPTEEPPATRIPPTFTVKSDDTTNIGEAQEVSIVGGTSDTMTVKDNGEMREDLSTQYLIENEMGQGINLGNTMEATKALGEIKDFTEATDFEQAWSAPITTQKYIDAIHSYGFNTLRIPVAWSSMVSDDGTYTIDEKMLGRVEEIVNYALNNGMYAIINIHWDYGWWGQFGSTDEAVVEEAWTRYRSYWEQITERFMDYSDHLIFESANEELGACLFDKVDEQGFRADPHEHGEFTEDQKYELTNEINQEFVDIVRASGGNNEYRHLLIAGDNTNIDNTVNDKFVMPEDTEENGNTKLSVSVHYYSPWDFCGDGMSGASYDQPDYDYTVQQFDSLKKFTDEGYGVIIGEFGVCNPRQNGVYEWLRDVMGLAAQRGLLPVLWDTPGMYFDRDECKMAYRDIAELYNAITGANGETESIDAITQKPANEISVVDIPQDKEPVWKWEGRWRKNDASNIGLDGEKVTSTDVSKFVQTDFCTDDTKNTFNDWGYQTFMHLDWSQYKQPCLVFTFEDDAADTVGKLELATVKKVNGTSTDNQKYLHEIWNGKGIVLANATLETLQQDRPYLYVTFGNKPIVTGIYVYDLGA